MLDFDGVIHIAAHEIQNQPIDGVPSKGFFEWADEARKHFELVIFSSRSDSHKNIKPMQDWLYVHLWDWKQDHPESMLTKHDFHFYTHKPVAYLTIDARALTFKGSWEDFTPEKLFKFMTWELNDSRG